MNFYLKTINLQGLVINNLLLSKANSQNCELSALNPLHGCSLADRLFHDILLAWFTCRLLAFELHLQFLLAPMVAQFSSACLYSDLSCFSAVSMRALFTSPVSFVYNTNEVTSTQLPTHPTAFFANVPLLLF